METAKLNERKEGEEEEGEGEDMEQRMQEEEHEQDEGIDLMPRSGQAAAEGIEPGTTGC